MSAQTVNLILLALLPPFVTSEPARVSATPDSFFLHHGGWIRGAKDLLRTYDQPGQLELGGKPPIHLPKGLTSDPGDEYEGWWRYFKQMKGGQVEHQREYQRNFTVLSSKDLISGRKNFDLWERPAVI